MKDCRCPFDEAVETFKGFIKKEGWSAQLLWLTRDRIVPTRREYFVFRPLELIDDTANRHYYEELRKTEFNIHIDALSQFQGHTLAYVQKEGGESRLLNFSLPGKSSKVTDVSARLLWRMVRWKAAKAYLSPVAADMLGRMTPEPGEIVNASAAAGLSENHLHD